MHIQVYTNNINNAVELIHIKFALKIEICPTIYILNRSMQSQT